jgi:hypothetical protein
MAAVKLVASKRELKGPAFPQLKTLQGVTRDLNQIQDNVKQATEKARKNPENESITLRVTVPASGTVAVNHRLGRKPVGYTQTGVITGAPTYTEASRSTRQLVLTGTAAGVIDLKVW